MAEALHEKRDEAQRVKRSAAPAAGRHEALERRPGAAAVRVHSALLARRLPAGGAVAQLMLIRKGDKISGKPQAVKAEVIATIARNKPQEMLDDIMWLDKSVKLRQEEQAKFKAGTKEYVTHAGRIGMEQTQRNKLAKAYNKEKAKRDKAKAQAGSAAAAAAAAAPPSADAAYDAKHGFEVVKKKK